MVTRASLLREIRQRAGHTQAQAADLVHVSLRSWERWEGGQGAVDETALHLYCLLVGVAYDANPAREIQRVTEELGGYDTERATQRPRKPPV